MNLNDYQREAMKTAEYPKEHGLYYVALGLAGEAGEISNQAKKILRDDNNILTNKRAEAMVKELGDVLWYVAMVADELDVDLEEVAKINIEKLTKRDEAGTIKGDGDNR